MGLKALQKKVLLLEEKALRKNLTIDDAIKLFPKDIYKYGYDLGRFLKGLGFTLEDLVTYSDRDTLGINFIFNASDYREYDESKYPPIDLESYLAQQRDIG